MTIDLAFRFCGLGSLVGAYISCLRYCNLFNWLAAMPSSSRDPEVSVRETNNSATPVTIVNIPSTNHVDPASRANAVADLDVLRQNEPRKENGQESAHRVAVHLLQTHQH
jgi:hypothetical protein